MNQMVSMILKWEKELENPDHTLFQWKVYERLLMTKTDKHPEKSRVQRNKDQNQSDQDNLATCPTCAVAS